VIKDCLCQLYFYLTGRNFDELQPGRFVLDFLANHKVNQVNLQGIMQGTCNLIKLAVSSQLNQVKVLSEEGVDLAEAIQQVEEKFSCTYIFLV